MRGFVHPEFRDVTRLLERLYAAPDQGGASLAIYHRGELVVDVWTGWFDPHGTQPWDRTSMAMCFSATKGVAATVAHVLHDRGLLDYDEKVATYWPEFGRRGKSGITVRHLLSHQAGMHRLRGLVRHPEEMLDHEWMATVLANASPDPEPGKQPGYHGLTYGWLLGEVMRRITGKEVGALVQEFLAEPLGLDGLHIGVPDDAVERTSPLFPSLEGGAVSNRMITQAHRLPFMRPLIDALVVDGFESMVANDYERVIRSEMPSASGVFTARSLAKLYGALANQGSVDGVRILSPATLTKAGRVQTRKRDYVLKIPMRWRLGYHQAFTAGRPPRYGFGHFGYGGSGAWADPETGLSVAFVTNRMGGATTPIADARLARIGAAALAAAQQRAHERDTVDGLLDLPHPA